MKNTILDQIIRHIRTKKVIDEIEGGAIVCDLGCDEGHFLKAISKKILKGYGFDKKINEKKFGNICLSPWNIENKLNIKATYITLLAVLEHLNNPNKVIKNCYRSLEKDGKIIITTPVPKAKIILEILSKIKLIDEQEIKDHKHYFNEKELYNLLTESGFNDIKIKKFELGMNTIAIAKK